MKTTRIHGDILEFVNAVPDQAWKIAFHKLRSFMSLLHPFSLLFSGFFSFGVHDEGRPKQSTVSYSQHFN